MPQEPAESDISKKQAHKACLSSNIFNQNQSIWKRLFIKKESQKKLPSNIALSPSFVDFMQNINFDCLKFHIKSSS